MRFDVRHETTYRYSAPVRLGDHVLRMTPRAEGVQALSHDVQVIPAPTSRQEACDSWGNPILRLGFSGETHLLQITSRFTCDVPLAPPPPAGLLPLPWTPLPGMETWLGTGEDPTVVAYAGALAREAGGDVVRFLDRLTQDLYTRTDRQIRIEGHAQSAAETLASATGACRDLSVLFMAACRSQGLPARFASGYQARAEAVDGRRHLHAWPEVWLPGAGWTGYDPTHGTITTDGHVALAVAPSQADTMPVEGGFWANGVTSTLTYDLRVRAI